MLEEYLSTVCCLQQEKIIYRKQNTFEQLSICVSETQIGNTYIIQYKYNHVL